MLTRWNNFIADFAKLENLRLTLTVVTSAIDILEDFLIPLPNRFRGVMRWRQLNLSCSLAFGEVSRQSRGSKLPMYSKVWCRRGDLNPHGVTPTGF